MALGKELASLLPSLVALAVLWSLAHSMTIKVYRNGERVMQYTDDNAEAEGRADGLPNSPLRGQMHYATPHRNACMTLDPANETTYNWFALIDNYFTCPTSEAWYLYRAGYGMMIAYSQTSDAELYSTPNMPRAIVTNSKFVQFLKNFTILGISPNASEYYVKVETNDWYIYERLFMIFGGVLLGAVALSVLIFCASIFCRTMMTRWRTRGLSRWRVRQLPRRRYRKDREVCESCSICLEDFKSGDNVRVLPCEHIFHPTCVDEWLQKWNRTCPLCKSAIGRRGAGENPPPPTSSTNLEQSHLLSHEGSEESQEQAPEGREPESYGALGNTPHPLSLLGSMQAEGGGEQARRSVSVSMELSDSITQSSEAEEAEQQLPNLVRNRDSEAPELTVIRKTLTTDPLTEQA